MLGVYPAGRRIGKELLDTTFKGLTCCVLCAQRTRAVTLSAWCTGILTEVHFGLLCHPLSFATPDAQSVSSYRILGFGPRAALLICFVFVWMGGGIMEGVEGGGNGGNHYLQRMEGQGQTQA